MMMAGLFLFPAKTGEYKSENGCCCFFWLKISKGAFFLEFRTVCGIGWNNHHFDFNWVDLR